MGVLERVTETDSDRFLILVGVVRKLAGDIVRFCWKPGRRDWVVAVVGVGDGNNAVANPENLWDYFMAPKK